MQNKLYIIRRFQAAMTLLLVVVACLFTLSDNSTNEYGNSGINNEISQTCGKVIDCTANNSISSEIYDSLRYSPGGMCFGVQLNTKGAIVIGFSKVDDESSSCPCETSGIKIKDIIRKIDGVEVNTGEEISNIVEKSGGNEMLFEIIRGGQPVEIRVVPSKSISEQKFKIGVWLRDSTAGIGTVTMLNPANNSFAGLGHGICDTDTGILMPLLKSSVSKVMISSIRKGKIGTPGELKGYFSSGKIGALIGNTNMGVYGLISTVEQDMQRELLPVARGRDVQTGSAYIYCTLNGEKVEKFNIDIIKINDSKSETKNFIIEIDDTALLDKTGGIVQGMSGSPIIQNGKIVGAVTHVMVNEPSRGYGIFIENMLEAMPELVS